MKTVEAILKEKGRHIWFVAPETTVFDALNLLAEKNVGALLVMEGKSLRGIISERDYARQIILRGRRSRETPVSEIMTRSVLCVTPERTVDECMALMSSKHVRHLPVLENDEVCGIISIGDVVNGVISEKDFHIDQLENYIRGR